MPPPLWGVVWTQYACPPSGHFRSKSPKNRFLDQYCSIFSHFSAKFWDGQNLQFWAKVVKNATFSRFFNLQRVARAWYEPKKSKVAKNGFNNPETVIVYDIESIGPLWGPLGPIYCTKVNKPSFCPGTTQPTNQQLASYADRYKYSSKPPNKKLYS